ncbi:hypothetical protein AtNW77_Chr3g0188941 [Arabidopsis thaliana]
MSLSSCCLFWLDSVFLRGGVRLVLVRVYAHSRFMVLGAFGLSGIFLDS